METLAKTRVLEKILECQNKILLLRIAKWKNMNETETKEFMDEYLDPAYYTLEWINRECIEGGQACFAQGDSLIIF